LSARQFGGRSSDYREKLRIVGGNFEKGVLFVVAFLRQLAGQRSDIEARLEFAT
jgi:hypothetical protein